MGDLDFDPSMSLKVKSNDAVGISIYGFLLMSNNNHMSISHRLADICTWKFSPYLLSLGQKLGTPTQPTLTPRRFFLKIESPYQWVGQKVPTQNDVDWLSVFLGYVVNRQTDRQTDGRTDRQTDRQTNRHTQCDRNKPR